MNNLLRYSVLVLAALVPAILGFPINHAGNERSQAASLVAKAPLATASLFEPPAATCEPTTEPTFDVFLPKLKDPPDEEMQGWSRPKVWGDRDGEATDDTITVPNGRPIYALFVSGYSQNRYLDELVFYNFARHLMVRGAYVHYAWWNNLLAPYMERPLHHPQSYPGNLGDDINNFKTAADANNKAFPGEDYQFVADATRFISAIREHNPNAMIIVVGHSMGGGAIIHLERHTNTVIDILAPIDPVGNRNYPWAGVRPAASDFNWTRWRITRDNFRGYKSVELKLNPLRCEPVGLWLKDRTEATADIGCEIFADNAPAEQIRQNVINLHFRYQTEYLFPFDYPDKYSFAYTHPTNGSESQSEVVMTPEFCGLQRCSDPGGWPSGGDKAKQCCEDLSEGVGWPRDGHGEIVGHRGPLGKDSPVPLGVRVRTSSRCGDDCNNKTWPGRTQDENTGIWLDPNSAARVDLLKQLEALPAGMSWEHSPRNPSLCLVSPGLISRFNAMNKPPVANAGPAQTVECTGHNGTEVTLDGRGSSDPDNDNLQYDWAWTNGHATGAVTTVTLPDGTYCITLTVRDPSGHIDRDVTTVTVQDTTPPDLTVELKPRLLWPPNHALWTITANVQAHDLCGDVAALKLLSIVSNQPDNGLGDGDTINDIQDAASNTLDLVFRLRAERSAPLGDRHYKVTYRATDDSDNSRDVSVDVVVPHDARAYNDWRQIFTKPTKVKGKVWSTANPEGTAGAEQISPQEPVDPFALSPLPWLDVGSLEERSVQPVIVLPGPVISPDSARDPGNTAEGTKRKRKTRRKRRHGPKSANLSVAPKMTRETAARGPSKLL